MGLRVFSAASLARGLDAENGQETSWGSQDMKNKKKYNVGFELKISVVAESLEEALEAARTIQLDDIVEFCSGHELIDAEIRVTGVYE